DVYKRQVLVGPSGCGKSTTLRMIAGLEDITNGTLLIGEDNVTHVEASKRGISMVFQNYALYPHMTVKENIEFGLKNNKVAKGKREELIKDVSKTVGLEEYLTRKPSDLSGGQRQRVALARSMVKTPKVFLMDEPLSNLDAKLRNQMRSELIQIHNKLKTTFVYVTHDQVEAMSMADKIVIMNKGEIMQAGSPKEIYNKPVNEFVAQFIGSPAMNVIKTNLKNIKIGFRPEKASLSGGVNFDGIILNCTVTTKEILGAEVLYCLKHNSKNIMIKTEDDTLEIDKQISIYIDKKDLYYFDEKEECIYDIERLESILPKIKKCEIERKLYEEAL
ncbi:ABC transporter ATP-binding protein, partial [Romboutsia weinsteinii]